jgi:hypothetical protein
MVGYAAARPSNVNAVNLFTAHGSSYFGYVSNLVCCTLFGADVRRIGG